MIGFFTRRAGSSEEPRRKPQPEWPERLEITVQKEAAELTLTQEQKEALSTLRGQLVRAIYQEWKLSTESYITLTPARVREIVPGIEIPDNSSDPLGFARDMLDGYINKEIKPKLVELYSTAILHRLKEAGVSPRPMSVSGPDIKSTEKDFEQHVEGTQANAERTANQLYEKDRQSAYQFVHRHLPRESDSANLRY